MEKQNVSALYETIFILRPELGGKAKEFADRFKKIIEDLGGTDVNVEEWGNRDLAYPIQKQGRGHYSLMKYRASMGIVKELERNMKLMEGVMRFLTVRVEEEAAASAPAARKEAHQETTADATGGAKEG